MSTINTHSKRALLLSFIGVATVLFLNSTLIVSGQEQQDTPPTEESDEVLEEMRRRQQEGFIENNPERYQELLEREEKINIILQSLEEVSGRMVTEHRDVIERFEGITERIESRMIKEEEKLDGTRFASTRSELHSLKESTDELHTTLNEFEEAASHGITPYEFDFTNESLLNTENDMDRLSRAQDELYISFRTLKRALGRTVEAVRDDIRIHGSY